MAISAGVLASRELRGGRGPLAGLALVIALGGGASLGAAVAAHRTDHAYTDYVRDAEVAELVVNPSIRSAGMDAAIRGFDGVEEVRVDSLLLGSFEETGPTSIEDAPPGEAWLQIRGSLDGRYLDIDRPVVTEGRLPDGERELFVSREYRPVLEAAQGRRLHVGDEIELALFWAGTFDVGLDPTEVFEPIGVERLTIAGFGVLPNEVLPEELFPRQQVIVSQDVTQRYYCLEEIEGVASVDALFATLLPAGCAVTYDYYSLRLQDGAAGSASIRDQFEAASSELSAELPDELLEQGYGYFYISQERADLDAAVRETTRPSVTALQAFALVAALATLTVTGLMAARQVRRSQSSRLGLRAVGATRSQLMIWTAVPLVLTAAAGVVGALALAFAASPIGPVGSVRSVAPSPGASLPLAVALPAGAAIFAALALVLLAVVARSSWNLSDASHAPRSTAGRLTRLVGGRRPVVATGAGAALDTRHAGTGVAAVLACLVATAATAAAVVFGASLSDLVDEPDAYGWPWDIAIVTGAGYGDTLPEVVDERLARADVRDDVVDHAFFGFDPALVIDGRPVPAILAVERPGEMELPLLDGRMPKAIGDALLGADTADALGLGVGDRAAVVSEEFGEIDVEVTGIGVLPSLGSFVADRSGLGSGALVVTESPEHSSPSLTALAVRDGTNPQDVLDRLGPDLASFSALGEAPVAHATPVRSPEIVDASELRRAPLVLGGSLLAGLMLALGLAVTLSVRDRRHELAVLRAIGFSSRDLRASVRWQGFTLLAIGSAGGIPLGVVGGRAAWRFFAQRLGVLPGGTVPVAWLLGEVALVIGLGVLAVAFPARAAARVAPADDLQVP